MSKARGNVLQNALARWLAEHGWPNAESAGAGRQGTDVTGTPGVVWECKTAYEFKRDFRPEKWVEQSKSHAKSDQVPVVVYFPPRVGEKSAEHAMVIVPLHVQVQLLREAGYC